jgi:peptidoglycan/LPS O-acetylase OafA/YrhL
MSSVNTNHAISISTIRALAIGLILMCHIFQGFNHFLAWWLNVGVQIFLFMSGFLFGGKRISDWKYWYKKRAVRLLPSYYIFLTIVCILHYFVLGDDFFGKVFLYHVSLIHYYTNISIPGIEHLWYISVIATCYLLMPLLQYMRFKSFIFFDIFILICLPLLLLLSGYLLSFPSIELSFNVFTFTLGYAIASAYKESPSTKVVFSILVISLFLILIRGLFQIAMPLGINLLKKIYTIVVLCSKPLIASAIFLSLYAYIKKLRINSRPQRVIKYIDTYSYELYLTHQLFILGHFSVLFITKSVTVNVILCILASMLSAITLKYLSKFFVSTIHVSIENNVYL